MWFDQNTPMNAQQAPADQGAMQKQMLAQALMRQAQNPGAATGNAGTTNIASTALAGALSGYMMGKKPGSGLTIDPNGRGMGAGGPMAGMQLPTAGGQ